MARMRVVFTTCSLPDAFDEEDTAAACVRRVLKDHIIQLWTRVTCQSYQGAPMLLNISNNLMEQAILTRCVSIPRG
jgi:hypothetical protein